MYSLTIAETLKHLEGVVAEVEPPVAATARKAKKQISGCHRRDAESAEKVSSQIRNGERPFVFSNH